jgi:phosphoesterase RecJ-like protein
MRYETNTSIESLADALRSARRVLVTTHQKPDGDAMGSVLAVLRACRAIGVRAEGWMVGPCEGNLRLFQGDDAVGIVDPRNPAMPDGEFDLAVVVDTGAWTQLEILAPWLRAMSERVIGLDHHARGDEVASRRIVDVSCGSCTALLIRLVDALGFDPAFGADPRGRYSIAEALYLGLATDTGWFRFPNARAAEFALASRLLAGMRLVGARKRALNARALFDALGLLLGVDASQLRLEAATDVHHIVKRRDGGGDEDANLLSLCHSHHSQITARHG